MNIELGQFGSKLKNMYIFGSRPFQDWQRIMIISFSIILGVFIWSYFFYFSVQSTLMSDAGEATDFVPVKDKEAEIKSVIEKYQIREVSWGVVATSTKATYENNNAVVGTSMVGNSTTSGTTTNIKR